jgi:hypothetical protein
MEEGGICTKAKPLRPSKVRLTKRLKPPAIA